MVISSTNPVHSVLSLVLAFANLSILLLLLGLEFLPILFLIVYVGAIAILFLFVIMMLNIKLIEILDNATRYVPIGVIIGFVFFWELYLVINNTLISFPKNDNNNFIVYVKTNLNILAETLYTDYFTFLLLGSLILLVAMLGAIVLTITNETGIKRQDLFAQISSTHKKTVKNINAK